jgi:hypothetical protein
MKITKTAISAVAIVGITAIGIGSAPHASCLFHRPQIRHG